MWIQVKVPGSCGELIQGTMNGVPFLVTCPIDLYSKVTVTPGDLAPAGLGAKSQRALAMTLEYFQRKEYPHALRLESELPPGKGMASSSADIAAVCFAVAASLGKTIMPETVAAIAAAIEPTDGIFFAGIVRMNPLTGICQSRLGFSAPLRIAIFDTGGTVDTLQFRKRTDLAALNRANEPKLNEAWGLLQRADASSLGQAATLSALANQTILPKAALPQIIAEAKCSGAIGVNVAHSGTVLGVLFAPDFSPENMAAGVARIKKKFPFLTYIRTARMIAGGYTIIGK